MQDLREIKNQGVFIGASDRLIYDPCYNRDRTVQSTNPLQYRVNANAIKNCNECSSLSGAGPRASLNGYGDATLLDRSYAAPAQQLIDVDSILSNRNVLQSKCKTAHFNPVNVTKLRENQSKKCNKFLDPITTSLTNPKELYRELNINRFVDIGQNPQPVIFWNFASDTYLEAIDNYTLRLPNVKDVDMTLPTPVPGKGRPCIFTCSHQCN